mgnify:CR=1 FL=1
MDVHEYPQHDVTVIWKPKLCKHAGVCVKMLPKVYDPKGRPWIKPENASAEALIAQINNCPSGALGYKLYTEQDASKG